MVRTACVSGLVNTSAENQPAYAGSSDRSRKPYIYSLTALIESPVFFVISNDVILTLILALK
jgi:hypothetical protein